MNKVDNHTRTFFLFHLMIQVGIARKGTVWIRNRHGIRVDTLLGLFRIYLREYKKYGYKVNVGRFALTIMKL